jgi:modulator of FtsH protease
MGQWSNYFVATAGGAAALAGLIFVSVSLNLKRILSHDHLPGRALGSLILLINILITGSFCLVPGQSLFWLGCEIALVGLAIWIINTRMDIRMHRQTARRYRPYSLQNLFVTQLAIVPYLVAAGFLLNDMAVGFYWLIPGITFSFIKSLVDSWVLLVEINR